MLCGLNPRVAFCFWDAAALDGRKASGSTDNGRVKFLRSETLWVENCDNALSRGMCWLGKVDFGSSSAEIAAPKHKRVAQMQPLFCVGHGYGKIIEGSSHSLPQRKQPDFPIWVWLKTKQAGLRRCWSMFPLTRIPFWVPGFGATAICSATPCQFPSSNPTWA